MEAHDAVNAANPSPERVVESSKGKSPLHAQERTAS